jgi:hypothetical protein
MDETNRAGPSPTESLLVVLRVAGRAVATVVALVCLYYLAPLDQPLDETKIAGLLLSIALLAVLMLLQIRAIEALATSVPLLVICFAIADFMMDSATFTEPLTRTDALYFALTVFSTVGFGDIAAVSQAGRAVVAVQVTVNLVAVGVGVRVILGAVQRGRHREAGHDTAPSDAHRDDHGAPATGDPTSHTDLGAPGPGSRNPSAPDHT